MSATRADLNNVFGNFNITRWADVSNNADEEEITLRVEYALALALEEVKAKLRLLTYVVDDAIELPLVIHATCQRAGDILYAPRAVSDEDPDKDLMSIHRKQYANFFKQIGAGQLDLGIPRRSRPYPKVEQDAIQSSIVTGY